MAPLTNSQKTIGILLLPGSPAVDVLLMVDCFNRANEALSEPFYSITVVDHTGNALFGGLDVDRHLNEPPNVSASFNYIVVFGGELRAEKLESCDVKWLLYHARSNAVIGSVGNSAATLVDLGLFTKVPVSLHWASLPSFSESYPEQRTTENLFMHVGRRFSCCGGLATLDLALYFVALDCGDYLASYVADIVVYDNSKKMTQRQGASIDYHLSISDERLLKAVKLMQQNLESPLDIAEISDLIGIGIRNLQRLFKRHLNTTPVIYYKSLRLWNARRLLLGSSIRISEIALACGFVSSSHFTACYREYFLVTPSMERSGKSSFHSVDPKHRESVRMSNIVPNSFDMMENVHG